MFNPKNFYLHWGLVGVAVAIVVSSMGTASAANSEEGSSYQESGALEEIIVTARKREEDIEKVPISIAVLSPGDLTSRSVDTFKELNDVVPNLKINTGIPNGGGSAAQIFIRGVGQYDYAAPGEPGVGLYVDDVYISRSTGQSGGLTDLARVEVLRGPQGTYYGRNTIGGAVKLVTNLPTGDTDAQMRVTVGSYRRTDVEAIGEFPISDKITARFTANTRNRDGLGTNGIGQQLGEERKQAFRGVVKIQANDSLDVILRADYHHQRQAGPAGSSSYFNPNSTVDLINTYIVPQSQARYGTLPAPYNLWGPAYAKTVNQCGQCVYSNLGGNTDPSRDDADLGGVSITADWNFSGLEMKSISAYRRSHINSSRDLDMSPFPIVETSNPEWQYQLSQELQLIGSSFDDRLKWLFGAYAFKEYVDVRYHATILGGLYKAIGVDFSANVPGKVNSTSLATFGEGTYSLTDKLKLTLGGRVTSDRKHYNVGLYRPESGVQVYGPATLPAGWTEFTPKAGFEFSPTDRLLFYASYSKGYKSGGFNSRELGGTVPRAFSPEFLTAYEIGSKSRLIEDRLTLNLAGFYNDYRDIQLVTVTDLGGGNVNTTISNAGKGRIVGGEFDIAARPTPSLRLTLSGGILDAKYLQLGPDALNAGITLNSKFLNAPRFSGSAAVDYEVRLGHLGSVVLHADDTYSGSTYGDLQNTPQLLIRSYSILNSKITYAPPSEKWEASIFGTNLTDKIYITNGLQVLALNLVESYYSRPREWGLSVMYKF